MADAISEKDFVLKIIYRYGIFVFPSCEIGEQLWKAQKNDLKINKFWRCLKFHRDVCGHLLVERNIDELRILLRSLTSMLGVFGCKLLDKKKVRNALSDSDPATTVLCPKRDGLDVVKCSFTTDMEEMEPVDFASEFINISSLDVKKHIILCIFTFVGTRDNNWTWWMTSRQVQKKFVADSSGSKGYVAWSSPLAQQLRQSNDQPVKIRPADEPGLEPARFQDGISIVIPISAHT
jgi:hypothetical protein